jgi:hypothetical protein
VPTYAAWLSIGGLAAIVGGIWINWGPGYALLGGGGVLFVTGGLLSRGEAR